MKFGGLVPFTLSDFPRHPAAIAFTQGCNFRCPFCHNAGLIPHRSETSLVPEEDVFAFLLKRRGRLDGLVVSGGEPTLHADLPDFLREVKRLGYLVKLDTNGSRPDMLWTLLDAELVDYIAMDVKAPFETYTRLAGATVDTAALQRSIMLIACSGVAHEFRTTNVEPLLSSEDLDAIRAMLPQTSFHRLQRFRPELAWDEDLRAAASA